MTIMESDSFFKCKTNECYFFSYANLNIYQLSRILGRKCKTILYQNCEVRNMKRIFCDDKNGSAVASIYPCPDDTVYGIVVKISLDELTKLESYHKNYTLKKIRVSYTSCYIKSYITKVDEDLKLQMYYIDKPILVPYVFTYDDYINNNKVKPTEAYVKEIRQMLDDRRKKEQTSKIKMIYVCVTTNENKEDEEYSPFSYYDTNTNEYHKYIPESVNGEKLIIIGCENI